MAYKELIVRLNSSRLEVVEVDADYIMARVIRLAIYIVNKYFFATLTDLGDFAQTCWFWQSSLFLIILRAFSLSFRTLV